MKRAVLSFFADTRGIITHEGGEGGRGDKKTSKSHRDHDTADTRGVSEDEREKGRRKRSSVAGQNTWGRKRRGEKENYLVHCCFAKAFLLFVSLGECRKGKRRRMDKRRRRMVEYGEKSERRERERGVLVMNSSILLFSVATPTICMYHLLSKLEPILVHAHLS